ncbi:hypothetical protein QBC37DRAFT_172170 [Rhypophila decipiens]|uniref:Uncharacterized protein n=1 Tax=Rhypophila decipiens TaxID=261697 RepID=A0AAN7B5G4_9PEZI|nr:hypothetical protein QBC37DRAFT_172170 [Rhypophila decipiens]
MISLFLMECLWFTTRWSRRQCTQSQNPSRSPNFYIPLVFSQFPLQSKKSRRQNRRTRLDPQVRTTSNSRQRFPGRENHLGDVFGSGRDPLLPSELLVSIISSKYLSSWYGEVDARQVPCKYSGILSEMICSTWNKTARASVTHIVSCGSLPATNGSQQPYLGSHFENRLVCFWRRTSNCIVRLFTGTQSIRSTVQGLAPSGRYAAGSLPVTPCSALVSRLSDLLPVPVSSRR